MSGLNALDRKVGQILADYLHQQDPRIVWTVKPATSEQVLAPFPGVEEETASPDRPATPAEGGRRHAA